MKNYTFFEVGEDFIPLMEKQLDCQINSNNVSIISTGWTNIVFQVKKDRDYYIFRFPRNQFFSDKIKNDAIACKFLKDKINLQTIDLKLFYDENRPYTMHKKITGKDLGELYNLIDKEEKLDIAKEIAEMYSKLHSLKINSNDPKELQTKMSDFLINLAKVDNNYYNFSVHNFLIEEEKKELVYNYGDLNVRNIVLNKYNKIAVFIDYSFFTISSRYSDLARIASSVEMEFLENIISFYEKFTKIKINRDILQQSINMWAYVEQEYIVYMKEYHKTVKIIAS